MKTSEELEEIDDQNQKHYDIVRSTWLEPYIKDAEAVIDWGLTKLGDGLVQAELTRKQIEICLADALEIYTKYAWFGPDKYLAVNLKFYVPGKGLDLHGFNISSVKEISTPRDNLMGQGMDMFFSPYAFFGQGMGSTPLFGMNGTSAVGSWVLYHNMHEWFELSRRMCGSNPDFQYDKFTQHLTLFPEPPANGANRVLLLTCQVIPSLQQLYGDSYVKRLFLANLKIQLGIVRKKFSNVQLIGGGQIDTTIGDEGKEELNAIIENIIKDESKGQTWVIA